MHGKFMPQGVSATIAAIVVSTLLIFIADVLTPLGIAVWILYVVPVRMAATLSWRNQGACYAMAALCTVLMAMGWVLSPPGFPPWVAAVNRTIGAVLLLGAALVFRRSELRQQQLAQSRELLQLFVAHAPAAIAMFDRELRYIVASQRWLADYQLQGQDIVGRSHYAIFPEIPERWRAIHRRCLEGAVETAREDRFERDDGSTQWLRWEVRPWKQPDGRIGGIIIFTEDITARKFADRSLQDSQEHARQLVDVLDLANVLVRDLDDRVTLWNTGMERLYGYRKSDALGRISHELLKSRFPVSLAETRNALLRDGHWNGEVVHTRKDGADMVVFSVCQLHRDASGQPDAILEMSTDLTLQKTAERALRDLAESLEDQVRDRTKRLEDANDQLEAFAYTVAHDLRAPLRAVHGFSQALLEDYAERLDEGGREYLGRNVKAAQALDGLIQDLLAYSRLGRADLQLSRVSLERVVSEVLQSLDRTVQDRQASISVEGPMPDVLAHSTTLSQAIQNLMSNALKFIPKTQEARVTVKAEDRGDEVRLWVEDNGIGIAPEHHGRIFRVFERLHGTDTYPGTGIGLSIVEKALERMHGRVGLESVPGQGSRFWIELQKSAAQPSARNLEQEV